ncbi:MAG: NYN domain-containing protein [Candidatus Marinimicrobia bacterium]|nr:NYN domain-containing protein [Candidatus Neomarinimicrobiota bacterium]
MKKANKKLKKIRVVAYVDGFNLYFGMRAANFDKYKWLNIKLLIKNLLHSNQELKEIKYFTSRISNNPDKEKRQTTYIEALESIGIKIYYGHYQKSIIECRKCGNKWVKFNEKMTDVNIATQMLKDAYNDKYNMAMLISGDSDLIPPIKVIHNNFTNKRVFVVFPPKRHNNSVSIVAKGSMTIGRKKLADSQFDKKIQKKDGFILNKPKEWK